jgi:hypothetical protein
MDEFNKTPLNRREYITANDPRDIIDLYGKKTLIDAKKQDTQKGFVEYHAIVVASSQDGLPKNTTLLQNLFNRFFGDKSSSPESEIEAMEVIMAYIVGPESRNTGRAELPHDNIPPPCSLITNGVAGLDEKTKLSLSLLEKLGTFFVAPGVKAPTVGSKIRVNFSQMPSSGVMRGGMYVGPITSIGTATEMDKKITQKCVGIAENSLDLFISSFQLMRRGRTDKFFETPSGLNVHLDAGYPGTCKNCGSCFEEIAIKAQNIGDKKFNIGTTVKSKSNPSIESPTAGLAANIISMYLPDGAGFTSGIRVAQDQQNILRNRLKIVINSKTASEQDIKKAQEAINEYNSKTLTMTSEAKAVYDGRELKNAFDALSTKYKLGLVSAPHGSPAGGHGNLKDSQSYAIDISGAPLDCIIKSVDLARQDFGDFFNFHNVIREAENNAVHVDFKITENGKKLRSAYMGNEKNALKKIKDAYMQPRFLAKETLLDSVKSFEATTLDLTPARSPISPAAPATPAATTATTAVTPAAPLSGADAYLQLSAEINAAKDASSNFKAYTQSLYLADDGGTE